MGIGIEVRLKKKTGIYWVLSCLRVTPFRDKSPIRGHAHRHSRQYHRIKGRATVAEAAPGPRRGRRAWCYSIHAVACHFFFLLAAMRPASADLVDCCTGPAAIVDCSSGVEYEGQHFFCMGMDNPEMRTCVTYLLPTHADVQCSSCCGTTTTDCDVEWSWGAVLATLSVSAVFATCSGILALAEKHRKRKGMSLARAWSLPQGMPVLRATVVDLSDAMLRRRSSIWISGDGSNDEDDLEHVGLLAEIPNDSIYGALVEQGDADIPVAKLAEDNWVTAMAWRRGATNPVSFEERRQEEETPPLSPPAASVSRWRSARAIARQARRIAAAASAQRDVGSTEADGGVWSVDAEQEAALSSSFRSRVSAVANAGLVSPVSPVAPVAPSSPASGEPS